MDVRNSIAPAAVTHQNRNPLAKGFYPRWYFIISELLYYGLAFISLGVLTVNDSHVTGTFIVAHRPGRNYYTATI